MADIIVDLGNNTSADPNIGVDGITVTTQTANVAKLSDILDVDTSNLDPNTNKFVMVYDASRKKYVFINPDAVIDASVGVTTSDPAPVGMTTETIQYLTDTLDVTLDNKIEIGRAHV